MIKINEFIESRYLEATKKLGSSNTITQNIESENISKAIDKVLSRSEKSKGVFTVVLTSLIYKILHPDQDIRLHQANMENGYSGRSFDFSYITPFLKEKKFPAMAESGWLTRSLEQNRPYNFDYPGSIRPEGLKGAFLNIIDTIEKQEELESLLIYIFQFLILQRNKFGIQLAKPVNLSIDSIADLLQKHFFSDYSSDGASRLPSLAFYSIYQCLILELKRFQDKKLLPIESHTSADIRSGRIGDIDIIDEKERAFEAVEIKHGIPISLQLVKDAYDKFSTTPIKRFYILSTVSIKPDEENEIIKEIQKIKNIHGCQVIVNGIIDSLKYYLRLLSDSFDFIEYYVKLLEEDKAIKFEHKQRWNELINNLLIKITFTNI